MASQTTEIGNPRMRQPSPIRATLSRVGEIVEMCFELLSLQLQLGQQDAKAARSRMKPAVVAIVLGLGLLLSGLPLLAFGLASGLSNWGHIPLWLAQIAMAVVCLVVGGLLFSYAWRAFSRAGKAFEASRLEAAKNLRWFRRTINDALH